MTFEARITFSIPKLTNTNTGVWSYPLPPPSVKVQTLKLLKKTFPYFYFRMTLIPLGYRSVMKSWRQMKRRTILVTTKMILKIKTMMRRSRTLQWKIYPSTLQHLWVILETKFWQRREQLTGFSLKSKFCDKLKHDIWF